MSGLSPSVKSLEYLRTATLREVARTLQREQSISNYSSPSSRLASAVAAATLKEHGRDPNTQAAAAFVLGKIAALLERRGVSLELKEREQTPDELSKQHQYHLEYNRKYRAKKRADPEWREKTQKYHREYQRAYYHRKKTDPEWFEKRREYNRNNQRAYYQRRVRARQQQSA